MTVFCAKEVTSTPLPPSAAPTLTPVPSDTPTLSSTPADTDTPTLTATDTLTPTDTETPDPKAATAQVRTETSVARQAFTMVAGLTATEARQETLTVRSATRSAYTPPPPTAVPVVVAPADTPTLAAAVDTPVPAATQPPAAAYRVGALCVDGSNSTATGSGACSKHGGVNCWKMSDGACVPK